MRLLPGRRQAVLRAKLTSQNNYLKKSTKTSCPPTKKTYGSQNRKSKKQKIMQINLKCELLMSFLRKVTMMKNETTSNPKKSVTLAQSIAGTRFL